MWASISSGVIGVIIAVLQGTQRIWRFDDTWRAYRNAFETMKRELRLYVNGAGDYAALSDEDAAYRAFVIATEQIIAEEQQIYWQARATATPGARAGQT
jgi:hypothetical protein